MDSQSSNCILQFYSKSKITNDPETMGGVFNWRQRLSNFWPVRISPLPIIVEGRELFNEGLEFSSIEQAFHYAKFQFAVKTMSDSDKRDWLAHYPGILTTPIPIKHDQVNDDTFAKIIRPIMVEVKGSSGKGKMKKAGYTLNIDAWDVAKVAVMEHLLLARLDKDDEFRSILMGSKGKYLLHIERSGIKSFWGGSLNKTDQTLKGKNTLGELMMKLRETMFSQYKQYCQRATGETKEYEEASSVDDAERQEEEDTRTCDKCGKVVSNRRLIIESEESEFEKLCIECERKVHPELYK